MITVLMAGIFQQIRGLSSNVIQNVSKEGYKNLIIGKQGTITTIGINRSEKKNCLNTHTIKELADALDKFEEDSTSNVVVLHGENGNFSSGLDIDEINERGYQTVYDEASLLRRFPLTWKLSVCGISGYAVAEGFELALMTDFRVIEDTAVLGAIGRRFGTSFVFSDGFLNINANAKQLFLTGSMIPGDKCYEYGIVDRSVSMGTALGQSVSHAGMIAKFPQKSLIYNKMTMLVHLLPSGSDRRISIEKRLASVWKEVVEETELNLKKFKDGVGKHGSFRDIGMKKAKSWELEEDKIAKKRKKKVISNTEI